MINYCYFFDFNVREFLFLKVENRYEMKISYISFINDKEMI